MGATLEAVMRRIAARKAFDRVRNRRKREVRCRTENTRRLPKYALKVVYEYPTDVPRPRVRSDCIAIPRPCPFVSCKYHLYLDVLRSGSIKLNFPDLEPDELEHSCCLDLADRGGLLLEQVGVALNLTRERIRQLESIVLGKLCSLGDWSEG